MSWQFPLPMHQVISRKPGFGPLEMETPLLHKTHNMNTISQVTTKSVYRYQVSAVKTWFVKPLR